MSVDEKNRMSVGGKNVRSAPDRQTLRLIYLGTMLSYLNWRNNVMSGCNGWNR